MAEGTSLMRRIARLAAPPPSLTPARALRLAATRGAERSIGLPLAVLGVAEEEGTLDELLSRLEDGLLVLALAEGSDPVGLVALDAEARAAAIEVQALGRVLPASPEPRLVTAADAALARPLLAAILAEVETALADTALAGWVRALRLGDRLPGVREATMLLADRRYRIVRLTLDLGAGGRQGLLAVMIRLPPTQPEATEAPAPVVRVADLALGAPTCLQAVLHRLQLPLDQAEGLEVGTVLPLPGVTVASVRVEGGGQDLGPARLGQVSGMRAIRIESPLAPDLEELPQPRGAADELALLVDDL
jgi:flagellar motor switch protein FliM